MLEVGIKAPDFELPDQNGKIHRLSDYTGKKVILYFYPKDNTLASSTTGRKMPKGWEPSLNPHSEEQPPHTQGISAIISGCSAFTTSLFSPGFNASVTSSVNVVRPTG